MWFSVHVKKNKEAKSFSIENFPFCNENGWRRMKKRIENMAKEVHVTLLHFTNAQT